MNDLANAMVAVVLMAGQGGSFGTTDNFSFCLQCPCPVLATRQTSVPVSSSRLHQGTLHDALSALLLDQLLVRLPGSPTRHSHPAQTTRITLLRMAGVLRHVHCQAIHFEQTHSLQALRWRKYMCATQDYSTNWVL